MGMYDNVLCEMPLPGPRQPKYKHFQTKDFSCEMNLYTIKDDGSLWLGHYTDEPAEPVEFHGLLNFYTYEGENIYESPPGMWFEYEAKFTDGKCVGIECVEICRQHFGGPREFLHQRADQVNADAKE